MRIAELLENENIEYDMETHPAAFTARELAWSEQARPHQVVKPVLVEADGRKIMCAVPGDRRIDFSALRNVLGCDDVHLVDESELERTCLDCEVGAEPPVGRIFGLSTVMDASVRDESWVYFQAGTHNTAIIMEEPDFERVACPKIGRFTRPV
jgi:Ala-tRNA(Pro) deacylase